MRLAATCAAAFVALSFVLFAVDELERGSANQVGILDGGAPRAAPAIGRPAPSRATERAREAEHGSLRELIDDGNDIVVAPFAGLVTSGDVWTERIAAGGLAGLVFGLGGLLLANFVGEPRRTSTDWRRGTS